ncbi:MAG: hypothetical protein RLZZ09_2160, partial [Pseudomonadota bacterium]|jgi:hypothetical protein
MEKSPEVSGLFVIGVPLAGGLYSIDLNGRTGPSQSSHTICARILARHNDINVS